MSNTAYNEAKTTGELTKQVANVLTERELMLTTAESCTGGNLATALCAEENTAAFYDVGLITFSDEAKQKILGVQASTLEKYTAVSEQTVKEMSAGRSRGQGCRYQHCYQRIRRARWRRGRHPRGYRLVCVELSR